MKPRDPREPSKPGKHGHTTCHDVVPQDNHDKLRLHLMQAGREILAASTDEADFEEARTRLGAFCNEQLLPHLERDELWLTKTDDCPEGRLLGHAMRTETLALRAAVYELASATTPCEAMGATRVVHALLAAHVHHQQLLLSTTRPRENTAG